MILRPRGWTVWRVWIQSLSSSLSDPLVILSIRKVFYWKVEMAAYVDWFVAKNVRYVLVNSVSELYCGHSDILLSAFGARDKIDYVTGRARGRKAEGIWSFGDSTCATFVHLAWPSQDLSVFLVWGAFQGWHVYYFMGGLVILVEYPVVDLLLVRLQLLPVSFGVKGGLIWQIWVCWQYLRYLNNFVIKLFSSAGVSGWEDI